MDENQEQEKQYRVYKYIFPDGKIYIGMTKNSIQNRRDCGYQHNERLRKAYRSCGWKSVKTIILEFGLTKEQACESEKKYISLYDATNPELGYNISFGGLNTFEGLNHSDAAKQMIRAANTGILFSDEHRRHISESLKGMFTGEKNPMFGKPKSQETIQKQYESHRKEMKPVIQFDLSGNQINIFDSMHQAAKAVNGHRNYIKKCCLNYGLPYRDSFWKFADKEVV